MIALSRRILKFVLYFIRETTFLQVQGITEDEEDTIDTMDTDDNKVTNKSV